MTDATLRHEIGIQAIIDKAFADAIAEGRLSEDEKAANWAGHYMFMGPFSKPGRTMFKNRETREYLK